jgi:hypothetical protein
VVECQLPKLDVAGSTPVARSTNSVANHRLATRLFLCRCFVFFSSYSAPSIRRGVPMEPAISGTLAASMVSWFVHDPAHRYFETFTVKGSLHLRARLATTSRPAPRAWQRLRRARPRHSPVPASSEVTGSKPNRKVTDSCVRCSAPIHARSSERRPALRKSRRIALIKSRRTVRASSGLYSYLR